jgi:hypothetical protein
MEQPISEKNAIALPKLMEKFRCIRAAIIRLTFYLHTYRLHANNACLWRIWATTGVRYSVTLLNNF